MCLIQGAIWTFRWGALAHIAMALGWRLNILKSKHVLLALAVFATLLYGTAGYFAAKNGWEATFPAFAGLRLAYAFLGGAALYGWQDKLPQKALSKAALLVGLLSLAAFQYAYLPWTPAIEIAGTFFWTYLAIVIIQTPMKITAWMNSWPNIGMAAYWPVSAGDDFYCHPRACRDFRAHQPLGGNRSTQRSRHLVRQPLASDKAREAQTYRRL